jgi:serine-type D-Ala-D-Ala carboxypeptidase/endopeptidase
MTSRLAAGVFALTLAASAPAAAQGHFPSDEAVREIARQAATLSGKIGIVIGVLEADGTRRVITVGDAPYDGRTLFEIGSITKVFTGILLAEMAERGEVRLEQPVAELLPGDVVVPSRNGRQIRLVDLSTHSSGLPRMPDNFTPGDSRNPYVDYTVPKLYDFLRRHELRRDIGVESEYSNVGVGLLGHALARRAGTSYEALVTARILEPLGMTSTKITLSPADVARLAPGHNARGQQVQNWDLAEAFAGAGGLRSNVDDMLTFLAANLMPPGSSTLGRAIRNAQTVHFKGAGGRKGGLGWGLSLPKRERNVLTHSGGTGGYNTFVAVDPERRLGVVVLSNHIPVVLSDQLPPFTRIGLHLLDTRIPVRSPRSSGRSGCCPSAWRCSS